MATPITWQNVNPGSFGDSLFGISRASDSIVQSLSGFNKMYQDEQRARTALEVEGRDRAGVEFKTFLQGFQTPEELAAAKAQGVIKERLAALDPRVRGSLLGADDARLTSLRQAATAGMQYQDVNDQRAAAPILEAFRIAGLDGNEAEQARIRTANPNIKGWGTAIATDKDLEAKVAQQKRALFEQERADKDYLQRQADAGVTRENALINLKANRRAEAEAIRTDTENQLTRNLEGRLAEVTGLHLEQRAKVGSQMGALAKTLGLPVDSNGQISGLNEDQQKLFNGAAKTQGLPSISEYTKGDTDSAYGYFNFLKQSGEFPEAVLAKNKTKILSGFDSTGSRVPIGTEALSRATTAARQAVGFEQSDQNNVYAPGSANARSTFDKLIANVPNLIDRDSGFGADEDIQALKTFVNKLAIDGVEFKSDKLKKTVRIVPSQLDVEMAIREAKGGVWSDKARAEDAEKILKKRLSSELGRKSIEDGLESQDYRNTEAVKKRLLGK